MKYELDVFTWGQFKAFTKEEKENIFNEILEFVKSDDLKAGYAGGITKTGRISKRNQKQALTKNHTTLIMTDKKAGNFKYKITITLHCKELVKPFLDKWEMLRNARRQNG